MEDAREVMTFTFKLHRLVWCWSIIIVDAIRTVLDYLRNDERRDHEAEPRRGHVTEAVARVDEWLSSDKPTRAGSRSMTGILEG